MKFTKKMSMNVTTTDRDNNPPTAPTESRFMQSIVYTNVINDRLTYIFQSDYGYQEDAGELNVVGTATPQGIGQDAEWYGINQYLFYTINDCWKAGLRGEWFRDDDGFRVFGVGAAEAAAGKT